MQTIRVNTSQNIDIDYEAAGLGERIVARIIDYAMFLLIFLLGIIVINLGTAGPLVSGIGVTVVVVVYLVLFVFYDLVCEIFLNGQSVGKRIMKIKVISLDGGQASIGQYLLRWIFRIVDFGIFGGLIALITAAVTEKGQRVGDLVAGTSLIKTSSRTKMDSVAFMPVQQLNYEPVYKEVNQLNDKDVALIHEVIQNYMQTGNTTVVFNMAARIKEHINVQPLPGMDDLQFLQAIVKDYNHVVANADPDFNV